MPLSYSSGYSSVRPTEIQQQQADPFASALQAVQERKKAQQERQQKLVQSREQFAKDDYYGMHADILRQASERPMGQAHQFLHGRPLVGRDTTDLSGPDCGEPLPQGA